MRCGAGRALTARTQSCTGADWSASAILAIVLSIMLMHFSGVITFSSPLRDTCRETGSGACGWAACNAKGKQRPAAAEGQYGRAGAPGW